MGVVQGFNLEAGLRTYGTVAVSSLAWSTSGQMRDLEAGVAGVRTALVEPILGVPKSLTVLLHLKR
eukprot:4636214-Amphidinium_carterae.2